MAPQTSALGMALNGKSAYVDIPKIRDGGSSKVNLTVVPGDSSKRKGMLLTPPHSISPNLPPHHHGPVSPTSNNQESDIDLQDAPQNLTAEALDRLSELDSAGAVTPALLAKHHLPEILLAHGPLAIRHIMGYLTATVPGFSRITSAKARRLVVAALEGRGNGAEGGGADGNVIFDKVGWGRWDARRKGQPPRDHQNHSITPPGSLPSSYSHGGMQVPDKQAWRGSSDRLGTSFATSGGFSHSADEYHDVLENEADNMSMDGDEGGYQSSEPQEPEDIEMDEGDVTDEEDWQSIGADALRARSLPPGSLPNSGGKIYQPAGYTNSTRYTSRPPLHLAKSMPAHALPTQNRNYHYPSNVNDSQERAAIEALLSLGSR